MRYAFPAASRKALRPCPRLRALHDAVFKRPRIRRYVASDRRLAFNNDDIFRLAIKEILQETTPTFLWRDSFYK